MGAKAKARPGDLERRHRRHVSRGPGSRGAGGQAVGGWRRRVLAVLRSSRNGERPSSCVLPTFSASIFGSTNRARRSSIAGRIHAREDRSGPGRRYEPAIAARGLSRRDPGRRAGDAATRRCLRSAQGPGTRGRSAVPRDPDLACSATRVRDDLCSAWATGPPRSANAWGMALDWASHIEYSVEPEVLLGTGGALRLAERFFEPHALVLNGDTYLATDYTAHP